MKPPASASKLTRVSTSYSTVASPSGMPISPVTLYQNWSHSELTLSPSSTRNRKSVSDTKLSSYLNHIRRMSITRDIKRPLTSKAQAELSHLDFLPDWLRKRKDFQEEYLKCPSFDLIDKAATCEKPAFIRNRFEKEALLAWVRKIPDLGWMSNQRLREICDRLQTVSFKQGETLMNKGDAPDHILLLLEGIVGVYLEESVCITEVKPPNTIGEAALKGHAERTATVLAHTPAKALRLRSDDYETIVFKEKAQERRDTTRFLASIRFFNSWKTIKLDRISSRIMVKSYQAGQSVFHQGDASANVFIVKSGLVDLEVFVEIEAENKWPVGKKSWEVKKTKTIYRRTVRTCKAGDLFGEKEVIKQCERTMQASCKEDTVIYIIERDLLMDVFQDRDLNDLISLNEEEPEKDYLKNLVASDHSKQDMTKKSLLDAFGVNPLPAGRKTFQEFRLGKRYTMAKQVIQRHRMQLKAQTVKKSTFFPKQ
mmetsp:Transcript_15911/g.29115  ORF Transcript_15911/g.29115 Transcript_15911/m.29115 type:complete len:482 (-) Transcript_15911:1232-2677(-)